MDKSNRPTYAQIETIYRWIEWHLPTAKARDAIQWFKNNATKQEASSEIKRLYDLYHSHSLNKDECFNSKVWERYDR